jgi:hypothetical protein
MAGEEGFAPVAHVAAIEEGRSAALEILVKAGCDVNQAANDGTTPAFSPLLTRATRPRSSSSSSRLRAAT